MTEKEKLDYQIEQILNDFETAYQFLMDYLVSKVSYHAIIGVFPFLCMLVVEGHAILNDSGILPTDLIKEKKLKDIYKLRSKGIKLYENFTLKTYNSVQKFNEKEFEKFLGNSNPLFPNVFKAPFVDNYFIVTLNNKIIGNYHLYTKKILNCEIGSYNERIPNEVGDMAETISWYITTILRCLKPKSLIYKPTPFTFSYSEHDLCMKKNYDNFSINNQPILMAFIDIVSILNYYNEFFCKINKNFYFGLKVKYAILFYGILGTKYILRYCENNGFSFKNNILKEVLIFDKELIHNMLHRYSLHYGYHEDWKENPIIEAFENKFNKPIKEIDLLLDEKIRDFADKLNSFLIVYPF